MEFTDEEVAKIRKLLDIADEIEEDQRRKMAWRLVVGSGRSIVIGLGGVVAAGIVIWEVVQRSLRGIVGD